MGSFVLVLIIIVFSLVRLSAKSKKGASKTQKSRAQQEADMQSMVQARRDARRQKENHTGLRQKFAEYKKAKQSSAKSAATVFEDMKKEDILTAAVENTVEVARDNDRDEEIWEVNLDQVYDLMVKGPADTMSFQRDFVAEGMDMLNRFTTLPDSGALSEYL